MRNRQGFHLTVIMIVIAVVGLLGALAYVYFSRHGGEQATTIQTSDGGTTDRVVWRYDDAAREWKPEQGSAPACREPFVFDYSPIDLSKANVIGMPGAYRGFDYKPHGGIRVDNVPGGKLTVHLPIDATLVGLTRYYEGDPAELQYLLTFETDCGIAFRFDHLSKLSPKFEEIAATTPEPKLNDTRTDPDDAPEPIAFKAGDIVATAVGFPVMKNFGFDFGVYDYRQRNKISENATWAALHENYSSLDWHGVCWLEMLPGKDAETADMLSRVQLNTQKKTPHVSDYCESAEYTTLDINGGKPTDG